MESPAGGTRDAGSALRRFVTHPALLVLLIAPFFGEGLSGSTPPLQLLLPWNLAFMAALYGCGALLCREVAHRFGLGFGGLVLLGVAYGIWEEALVDRYWFYPTFWKDSGIGHYSVVWHTNALIAVHLTVFHTTVSICSSVLVVEWLVPRRRGSTWTTRPGLALAALVLAATPVVYGEFDRHPPAAVLVAAAGLLIVAVIAAFAVGRIAAPVPHRRDGARRRGVALVAFAVVLAHWIATYGIAETAVPGAVGVLVAVTPIVLGAVLLDRLMVSGPYGADGMRVVAGILVFFALLDVFVGLTGEYDLVLGGVVAAYAARRLGRRARRPPAATGRAPDVG